MTKLSKNTQSQQSCITDVRQSVIIPQNVRLGNKTSMGKVIEITTIAFYVRDKNGEEFKNTWAEIEPLPITTKHYDEFYEQLLELQCEFKHSSITNRLFIYIQHLTIQLDYVHELQNLFHSLLQRELTVA